MFSRRLTNKMSGSGSGSGSGRSRNSRSFSPHHGSGSLSFSSGSLPVSGSLPSVSVSSSKSKLKLSSKRKVISRLDLSELIGLLSSDSSHKRGKKMCLVLEQLSSLELDDSIVPHLTSLFAYSETPLLRLTHLLLVRLVEDSLVTSLTQIKLITKALNSELASSDLQRSTFAINTLNQILPNQNINSKKEKEKEKEDEKEIEKEDILSKLTETLKDHVFQIAKKFSEHDHYAGKKKSIFRSSSAAREERLTVLNMHIASLQCIQTRFVPIEMLKQEGLEKDLVKILVTSLKNSSPEIQREAIRCLAKVSKSLLLDNFAQLTQFLPLQLKSASSSVSTTTFYAVQDVYTALELIHLTMVAPNKFNQHFALLATDSRGLVFIECVKSVLSVENIPFLLDQPNPNPKEKEKEKEESGSLLEYIVKRLIHDGLCSLVNASCVEKHVILSLSVDLGVITRLFSCYSNDSKNYLQFNEQIQPLLIHHIDSIIDILRFPKGEQTCIVLQALKAYFWLGTSPSLSVFSAENIHLFLTEAWNIQMISDLLKTLKYRMLAQVKMIKAAPPQNKKTLFRPIKILAKLWMDVLVHSTVKLKKIDSALLFDQFLTFHNPENTENQKFLSEAVTGQTIAKGLIEILNTIRQDTDVTIQHFTQDIICSIYEFFGSHFLKLASSSSSSSIALEMIESLEFGCITCNGPIAFWSKQALSYIGFSSSDWRLKVYESLLSVNQSGSICCSCNDVLDVIDELYELEERLKNVLNGPPPPHLRAIHDSLVFKILSILQPSLRHKQNKTPENLHQPLGEYSHILLASTQQTHIIPNQWTLNHNENENGNENEIKNENQFEKKEGPSANNFEEKERGKVNGNKEKVKPLVPPLPSATNPIFNVNSSPSHSTSSTTSSIPTEASKPTIPPLIPNSLPPPIPNSNPPPIPNSIPNAKPNAKANPPSLPSAPPPNIFQKDKDNSEPPQQTKTQPKPMRESSFDMDMFSSPKKTNLEKTTTINENVKVVKKVRESSFDLDLNMSPKVTPSPRTRKSKIMQPPTSEMNLFF